MRTLDKIITEVSSSRGAPMGRQSTHSDVDCIIRKLYDCKVPMSGDGAYDRGGAYWGTGSELRVKYTKDLSVIFFYRMDDLLMGEGRYDD